MGAFDFLDRRLQLEEVEPIAGDTHALELYRSKGELFLRLWTEGPNGLYPLTLRLSREQAAQIAVLADDLAKGVA